MVWLPRLTTPLRMFVGMVVIGFTPLKLVVRTKQWIAIRSLVKVRRSASKEVSLARLRVQTWSPAASLLVRALNRGWCWVMS